MISHEISRSSNKFSNNPYIEQTGPETDHGMDLTSGSETTRTETARQHQRKERNKHNKAAVKAHMTTTTSTSGATNTIP